MYGENCWWEIRQRYKMPAAYESDNEKLQIKISLTNITNTELTIALGKKGEVGNRKRIEEF